VLTLEVEEQAALRHQRILEANPNSAAATASEENYARWKTEREALLVRASQPSVSVQTVTSFVRAHTMQDGDDQPARSAQTPLVEVEKLDRGGLHRPSGRRFGALVHVLLATLELDAGADAIQAAAALNGKVVGATNDEIEAGIAVVSSALEHPIMRRAAASAKKGALRRETPILHTLEGGSLVEGVVDLAFREDEPDFTGWTVIDFKTDREFEGSSAQYISQVRLYTRAVGTATNAPARGMVLVV
jgi:ATP-dependent exoDNAse (exonuclease V) beta subunit